MPDTKTGPCIHVAHLHRRFGSIQAVRGISFDVPYGSVFGFLGPNGAGKTTTIKVLTTLIPPTSGHVTIFGKDIVKESRDIRKRIGVVFQEPSFEANLTVERALDLYGRMWQIPSGERKKRVNELLDEFDLQSIRGMKNDELSIGQRRRVQVAREFIHDVDLLFLDEPTVGLDPSARRALLDSIKTRVRTGLTVFFTTHIMEEAEYLCNDIAIINGGTIVATDTPDGLKKKFGGAKSVVIKLREASAKSITGLLESVVAGAGAELDTPETDTVRITSFDAQELLVQAIDVLSRHSVQIESVSVNPPTLEEVFLKMVRDAPRSSA